MIRVFVLSVTITKHVDFPLVGAGKQRRIKIGPWGNLKKAASITRAALRTTGPVPPMIRVFVLSVTITKHVDFPLVGAGKQRRIKIGPWGNLKKAAPITRAALRTTGPVPADSRQ